MRSLKNINAPFWIIDFGVNLVNIPTSNYSKAEEIDNLDEHFHLDTELLIFLDASQFERFPLFRRGNFQLVLIANNGKVPSQSLISKAAFCCFNKDQKIISDFLNPYIFNNKQAQQKNSPSQLHLICGEDGTITYQDQSLLNFFGLEGADPLIFTDIPIKFRFGEFSFFEPLQGLLNQKEAHAWISFRSTTTIDVLRVYLNKTVLNKGTKTFYLFFFNLWPEISHIEETFKENITAFSSILEDSFDAILIYDSSKIIKYASPGITRLVGYHPEEIIGLDIADFTFPEDAELNHPLLAKVRKGEISKLNVQQRLRHKNGNDTWVDLMVSDKRSTPGINGIVCSIKDINTEKRSRLALEESNMRFELASKATKDVIWDLDLLSGKIIWGQNVKEVFGWEAEELDTAQKLFTKIPERYHKTLELSLAKVIASDSQLWTSFYDFYCKNGNKLTIEDKGYVSRDKNGIVYRVIGAMHDNTDTKNYENQIIKGEERFRRLFEESLIGVSLIKLENFSFLDCNQALLNILGYRREEILKLCLIELIPASEKSDFFQEMAFLRKSETAQSFQLDLIRKDQSIIKVALSSFTSLEENNEPSAWMHVLDLSPIIQSNAALKDAENRFRSYVEKSSDIFVTLNASFKYEYVSPNISKLLGYSPSEVIGLDNFDIIHPEDHEVVLKAQSAADGEIGKATRSVFRALHKNGSTRWVEANGKVENTDQGPKAFINIRDIEKEHQIELELQKLSLVANKTDTAVIITNQAFLITWANPSFENLTGYSFSESINNNLIKLLPSQSDAQKIAGQLHSKKALKLDLRIQNKAGKKIWIGLSITSVFNSEGKVENYIFLALDISDRKAQEREVQQNITLIKKQLKSLAHLSSHSLLAHCQNIETLALNLKSGENTLGKAELADILNEKSRSLSDTLTSIQSLLNYSTPKPPLQELLLIEHIERAKRLLSKENRVNFTTIQYSGNKDFKVRFYAPYLEDALFTIFTKAIENTKDSSLKLRVEARIVKNFRIVDIILPPQKPEDSYNAEDKGSKIFFSFEESLELLKYQLQSVGGELKQRFVDDFKIVLSLYFKDSD